MMYLVQLTNKKHEKIDSQDFLDEDREKYMFTFTTKQKYQDIPFYKGVRFIDNYYASRYDKVGRFE